MTGRVLDTAGAPVPGARVRFLVDHPLEERPLAFTATDADGAYALTLDFTGCRPEAIAPWVEVSAPGFARSLREALPLRDGPMDLRTVELRPEIRIPGRVLDERGLPLAGATLHVAPNAQDSSHGIGARHFDPPRATSDEDGRFGLTGLPTGRVTVGLSAPGYADRVMHLVLGGDREPDVLEHRFTPETEARLLVLDAEGQRCARAVALSHGPTHTWPGFWRRWEADRSGSIHFEGYGGQEGSSVFVVAPGHEPRRVEVRPGRQTVRLVHHIRIEVVATRSESPAPELESVRLREGALHLEPQSVGLVCGNAEGSRWVWFDEDSPAVTRLAPDRWLLTWNHPAEWWPPREAPGEVVAISKDGNRVRRLLGTVQPGELVRHEIELPRPGRLAGTIVDANGAPLPARVRLRPRFPIDVNQAEATADERGRFDLGTFPTEKRWLTIWHEGRRMNSNPETIELAPGEARTGLTLVATSRADGPPTPDRSPAASAR